MRRNLQFFRDTSMHDREAETFLRQSRKETYELIHYTVRL